MKYFLTAIIAIMALHARSIDKPLDFWDEEIRLFCVADAGKHVDSDLSERIAISYVSQSFAMDHSTKKEGDFSVLYVPGKSGHPPIFGFVSNLWLDVGWNLSPSHQLNFWLKVDDDQAPSKWKMRLIDSNGAEAVGTITKTNTSGEWEAFSIRLKSLKAPKEFNWSSVKMCEFDAVFGKEATIWLDGIRFEGQNRVIGVTDKSLVQRMEEAEASRNTRIGIAFKQSTKTDKDFPALSAFAKMFLNEDLETANQLLVDELKKSSDANAWSLFHTPIYCRFYYFFSNRNGKYPGRMTPETEKLLLETLWDRTAAKNDIAWARQSTWYLDGSENHDLNAKACNLVTSRIFMNEPDYKDRIYPDYGFGGSYHYGHAGYYGPGIDPESRHGGGRANLADGKEYKARDHYEAWLVFLKTYFRERAERGFFLEYASNTYTKHSLNMVDLAYQYCGDEELHHIVGNFLTLFWAEWAQVSISGERGGPKTRHHHTVFGKGDSTYRLISYHMGGPATAGVWWYWNIINDYNLPPVVWKMAMDREGMGCYTYKARGIGEEENVLPRPPGTERSLVVDTDARFLKNTYVTPDYTLGTQMDHPSAVHSHLSNVGRWHGMTFAQSAKARIVPVCLPGKANKKGQTNPYELEAMYQTVQHEQTLIVQQSRRWYAVHPEWYLINADYNQPIGIWFGLEWDQRIETLGWIFVQRGNAYAAVRPVMWDEQYEKEKKIKTSGTQAIFNAPDDAPTVKLREDCYRWNSDSTIILLEDNHLPVIIQAGRVADYPTLDDFMHDVLDNPVALYKTVVPGNHILVYSESGADAKEIVFNASVPEIPTIGNEPVNYSHPMTFDSPYIKSEYKSGKIHIEYDNEILDLDFN